MSMVFLLAFVILSVVDVMVWASSSGGPGPALSISLQLVSDVMVRALSSDAFGAGVDSDG